MAHTSLGTRVNRTLKGGSCLRIRSTALKLRGLGPSDDVLATQSVDHGTYITWDANQS